MKKLRNIVLILVIGFMTAVGAVHYEKASDSYIRQRTFLLHSSVGSCTGVEVIAPSGKNYILTAGHCYDLLSKDKIDAQDEQGEDHQVRLVKLSRPDDLMLLTAIDLNGIKVADVVHKHEHIHAITHGLGYPSYRTDGEVLRPEYITIGKYPINSPEDMAKCEKDGFDAVLQFPIMICGLQLYETAIHLEIWPGSSGGPILNDAGELVGIASANNSERSTNSFMVPLSGIHWILSGR